MVISRADRPTTEVSVCRDLHTQVQVSTLLVVLREKRDRGFCTSHNGLQLRQPGFGDSKNVDRALYSV